MPKDPTKAICKAAASFPNAVSGTSCNQTSFKVGKTAFLYIGPGAKQIGYKAMFKLDASAAQAKQLAVQEPKRFEVGSTAWVTVRFTDEEPLAKTIWSKWLRESYELCARPGDKSTSKKSPRKASVKKRTAKKRTATNKKAAAKTAKPQKKKRKKAT